MSAAKPNWHELPSGNLMQAGCKHRKQSRQGACGGCYAKVHVEHERLLAVAQVVLDGLHARIQAASDAGEPLPVFDGIADLHDALAKAGGR